MSIQQATQYKNKGNQAFKQQKYQQSIELFTKAIELNPNDHVFYSNRSGAYVNTKQYEEALKDAQKCIEINPAWPKGYSRKGTALFYLGDIDEAIKSYQEGLKIDPNNAELKKNLNDAQAKSKEQSNFNPAMLQAYVKLFNHPQTKQIMQDPTFMPIIQQLMANPANAMQYMADPRVQKIMKVLQSQTQPDQVQKIKKMFQKQNGAQPEQKSQQKPQFKSSPTPPPHPQPKKQQPPKTSKPQKMQVQDPAQDLKNKGNESFKKKNFTQALNYYDEAIKINPNQPLYYNNKAAVYIQTKQFDLALQEIRRAEQLFEQGVVKDFSKKAKVLARKGTIYSKTGNLNQAIAALQKSLMQDSVPKVKDQLHKLKVLKKQKQAKQYINPELAEKHNQNGAALYKQGKFPQALQQYQQAVRRNPDLAKYYSNIGQVYIKLMQFQRAKQNYDLALKKDPNFQKAYHKKADCHFALKEYHKAMEVYEQGLKKDPNDANCKQGLEKTQYAIFSSNTEEDQKIRAQRAMADPQIQAILSTPQVRNALAELQRDPKSINNILKDKSLAAKLQKLIAAGIIRTG